MRRHLPCRRSLSEPGRPAGLLERRGGSGDAVLEPGSAAPPLPRTGRCERGDRRQGGRADDRRQPQDADPQRDVAAGGGGRRVADGGEQPREAGEDRHDDREEKRREQPHGESLIEPPRRRFACHRYRTRGRRPCAASASLGRFSTGHVAAVKNRRERGTMRPSQGLSRDHGTCVGASARPVFPSLAARGRRHPGHPGPLPTVC